jgi:hypothetical protein
MLQTLIKDASYPNNFVFVLQFSMFMKVAFYTLFYVWVFLVFVLGLHSSGLASKMHFESSKVI